MKKVFLLAMMSSALIWSSCGDDTEGNNPEPQKSAKDYLMDADWLLMKATITPPIVIELFGQQITISDLRDLDEAEPCDEDDLIRFKADGSIENDEGPTKCDPEDPQTYPGGSWNLSTDEKTLTIIEDEDTTVVRVTLLNDMSMKGTTTILLEDPITEEEKSHTVNFEFEDKKN